MLYQAEIKTIICFTITSLEKLLCYIRPKLKQLSVSPYPYQKEDQSDICYFFHLQKKIVLNQKIYMIYLQ